MSERRFLPLRFRACLFSRQPTARAWSPPSPKPPRAACSELSSSAETRSWTSSSIVRRKCLRWMKGKRYCEITATAHTHLRMQLFFYWASSSVRRTAMGAIGILFGTEGRKKKCENLNDFQVAIGGGNDSQVWDYCCQNRPKCKRRIVN